MMQFGRHVPNVLMNIDQFHGCLSQPASTLAIKEPIMANKVKLTLVGIDNAFSLMSAFKTTARRQGWTGDEIDVVLGKCMSGDYNNLLCTLMDNCEDVEEEESDPMDDFNYVGSRHHY